MKISLPTAAALLSALFLAAVMAPAVSNADPDKKEKVDPDGSQRPSHGGDKDPFAGLSAEERQQFREAMGRAWNDPAVLQARDEVKAATMSYQKALDNAVRRIDPEVVAIMNKIRKSSDSPVKRMFSDGGGRGPGRGPGSGRDFREFENFLLSGPSQHLEKLDDEQKKIFKEAREKALKSPEFQEVIGTLREMRAADDELRKKRIEIFRRASQALRAQMVKADERVKEFLPKNPPNGRRGPGEKGAGPPRKPGGSGEGKGSKKGERPEVEE